MQIRQAKMKFIKIYWKIKMLVKEDGYQEVVIVGHSSDDDLSISQLFKSAGADYFETKPPILNNFKFILDKIILNKE